MKVLQEEDHISGRMVLTVSVVTTAIFAAAIVVAWWILSTTAEEGQPTLPGPHEPIAKEINNMDRWLFRERADVAGERDDVAGQRAEIQRLDSYGWVDREQKIIHIPVTQAMELYLKRQSDTTPASLQPRPTQNLPGGTP